MVAGLMEMPDDVSGMPPAWTLYFGVDDADRAAAVPVLEQFAAELVGAGGPALRALLTGAD